jgi:hypothetical protein
VSVFGNFEALTWHAMLPNIAEITGNQEQRHVRME